MQIWNQDPNQVSLLLQDITQHLFGTGQVPFVGPTDTKLIQPKTMSFTWTIFLTTLHSFKAPVSDSELTEVHFVAVTTLAANFKQRLPRLWLNQQFAARSWSGERIN